ncbi:MAG: outer membrane protein assembly factor BamD [Gammaproteobacteria bacterium]
MKLLSAYMPTRGTSFIKASLVMLMLASLIGCASQKGEGADGEPNVLTAEKLYDLAKGRMESKNFRRAIQIYEALEVRFPFSEFTRQGQLDLMYAHFRSNNTQSAVEAATRFIRENPRHPKADYAYYMRGLANFPVGLTALERVFRVSPYARPQDKAAKSFDAFSTLIQRYPDSEWAEDARQRMVYLRNAMAKYELEVAEYYLRRGANIAAANRAKRVIDEFQETDAVLEALRIQIAAYNNLELTDLASDAQRVLDQNLSKQ